MSAWRSAVWVRVLGCALPFGVGAALAVVGALRLDGQSEVAARVEQARARLDAARSAERELFGLDAAWRAALARPEDQARQAYEWLLRRLRSHLAQLRRDCEAPAVRESLANADALIGRWNDAVVAPSFAAGDERQRLGTARDSLASLVDSDLPALLRERARARIAALQGAFRFNDRAHDATLALERDLEVREGALRAFLLDGRGEDLGRLEAAAGVLAEHLAELRGIAPQQAAAIDELAGLTERWSREVAAPQIQARRALPASEPAPLLEVALAESPLLEQARAALRSALEAEQADARRLESELWRAALHGQRWTLESVALVAVLGALAAWSMGRRARSAAEPAGAVRAIARIDRNLQRLARRQDDLAASNRPLVAASALPAAAPRAALSARAAGSARGQIEDLLVWLACRQETLFLALYTLHGPAESLSCELAVGWKGRRLAASQFSPRGLHDGVLCTGSKTFVDGPFELAGEFLGLETGTAVAGCVIGWPVAIGPRRMGVLLAAHRERPSSEAEALTGSALEWIADLWVSARKGEARPAVTPGQLG